MMYFKVDFYDKFTCQMCGSCCRNDWLVTVSEESYQRNAVYFAGRDGEFSGAFIPLGSGSSPGEYAYIAKQADGGCWFLENNALCRLHREAGHDHLDQVCQIFPRYPMDTARGIELTLSFSCPAVVSLASRSMPLEIVRSDYGSTPVDPDTFVITVYPEQQPAHSPLRYYFELEHHFIDILQCRTMPLEERLQLIRHTADLLSRVKQDILLGQELNQIFHGNYQLLDCRAAISARPVFSAAEYLLENYFVNLIFKKIFYRYGLQRSALLLDGIWQYIEKARMNAAEPATDLVLTQAAVIELEIRYAHDRKAPHEL